MEINIQRGIFPQILANTIFYLVNDRFARVSAKKMLTSSGKFD